MKMWTRVDGLCCILLPMWPNKCRPVSGVPMYSSKTPITGRLAVWPTFEVEIGLQRQERNKTRRFGSKSAAYRKIRDFMCIWSWHFCFVHQSIVYSLQISSAYSVHAWFCTLDCKQALDTYVIEISGEVRSRLASVRLTEYVHRNALRSANNEKYSK